MPRKRCKSERNRYVFLKVRIEAFFDKGAIDGILPMNKANRAQIIGSFERTEDCFFTCRLNSGILWANGSRVKRPCNSFESEMDAIITEVTAVGMRDFDIPLDVRGRCVSVPAARI